MQRYDDQIAAAAIAAPPVPVAPGPQARPRIAKQPNDHVVLRGFGAVIGTIALSVSLIVAITLIFQLPQLNTDVNATIAAIGICAVVGVVLGALPLWFSARPFAKALFAATALVLVTAGLSMLAAAPVVRQMNTPELAEYRGFRLLFWFGLACLIAGLVIAAACVHWSMAAHARKTLARWSRILGSAYGVLLAFQGLSLMFLMLTLINGEGTVDAEGVETSVVETAILFTSIAMWTLVPGLILTYHGISASMGEGSGPFRPPIPALAVAAFVPVLLVGHVNMSSDDPVALPMPFLHVLGAALPSIGVAALAGRGSLFAGRPVLGLTWRQVSLAAAISMAVATTIAIYVESFGSLFAVVLLLVHNGAFETAANAGEAFDIIADSSFILTENEQFAAGLITAAVLAPISEEFAKSLGARFMMRPHTTRAQAFLLGAVAGAAFGFLEDLLYGLAAISGGNLDDWWAIMLLRGGSTSLHVLCTGLAGLGWWYWSIGRRHRLSLALFGIAVAIHALWNGAFTAIDSRILGLDTLDDRTIAVAAYSIVAVVSAAMLIAIPLIAQRLRSNPLPPMATPPEFAWPAH